MAEIALLILVGFLTSTQAENTLNKKTLQPISSVGEGAPVYGMHQQGSDLYLIRDSTTHIEIYSALGNGNNMTMAYISGIEGPYDMVGFARGNLYILDWFDWGNITVCGLLPGAGVLRFSIQEEEYTSVALAVDSNSGNVIVTCSKSQKVKEFTSTGQLVREVDVHVVEPRHTIKLRSGVGYVTCHGYEANELHRVCRLDNTGVINSCYGGASGSGIGQLDVPARLLEDDDGNILVADQKNKRIVLLSPSLVFIRYLVTSDDGLQSPYRMLVSGPLLYVADNTLMEGIATAGRVYLFNTRDTSTSPPEASGSDRLQPIWACMLLLLVAVGLVVY